MLSLGTTYKIRNLIILFLVVLFIFLIIFGILFFLANKVIDKNIVILTRGSPEKMEIYEGINFRQDFIGDADNLNGIGIKMHNFYTQNNHRLKVKLLRGKDVVFEDQIPLKNIAIFYLNYFKEISDSKDKNFTITLEANTPKDNPLAVYVYKNNNGDSNIFLNGEKTNSSLFFFKSYLNSESGKLGWNNFNLIIDRISQYKPFIFKGAGLVLLVIIYLVILFFYLYLFVKNLL